MNTDAMQRLVSLMAFISAHYLLIFELCARTMYIHKDKSKLYFKKLSSTSRETKNLLAL